MSRICQIATLLLGTIAYLLTTSPAWGLHVVIDPGHGGKDHGAVRKPYKESEITLQVAQRLHELLAADPRFNVSLTREREKTLSLKDRSRMAERYGGEVFISIHANSSRDTRASGGEIYFQNQLQPDVESMFLANKENQKEISDENLHWPLEPVPEADSLEPEVIHIIKDLQRNYRLRQSGQLAKSLALKWQGSVKPRRRLIRQAPFYVVSNVAMPSVLVELGFLSNPRESRRLSNPAYQKKLARGIYEGLCRYKEVMDNVEQKDLH